eukprot:TRINITY_DN12449_c0_g1_i1.p1 TRINITY_DN12449_c0_g1~~TRINITY_DN12449_c0_g1_i1.p1  ORF type:complete len:462 (-),score=63.12 TRINITY_DN12449_c0_g1_i1:5-1369(-)
MANNEVPRYGQYPNQTGGYNSVNPHHYSSTLLSNARNTQPNQGHNVPVGPQAANVLGRFGGTNAPMQQPQVPQQAMGRGATTKGYPSVQNSSMIGTGMSVGGQIGRSTTPQQPSQLRNSGGMMGMSGYAPSADMIGMMQKNQMGNVAPTYSSQASMPSLLDRSGLTSSGNIKNEAEFNLGGEDFPALPGFKSNSESNLHSDLDHSHFGGSTNPYGSGKTGLSNSGYTENSNNPSRSSSFNNVQRPVAQKQTGTTIPNTQTPNNQTGTLNPQNGGVNGNKSKFVADRFGLLGLLSVIRMTDPDLNTLALGTDLTTLGLNLNSPDCLYSTFASPWAKGPSRREPEFYIPMCYYMQTQLQSPMLKMSLFSEETLFYIFYSMPKDTLQIIAAQELFKREWRFHKEHRLWLTRVPGTEVTKAGRSYIYFDVTIWEKVRKDNLHLVYEQLETTAPTLQTS